MSPVPRIFGAIVFAAAAGQAAAVDVGRVVLSAGDTTALRQGQVVRLNYGTPVQDKDTLRTGAASNLQVRFEDDSYVSLRESSELRVQEFAYSGKEDGIESAVFNLLKGGMRAITGLVGRRNHDDYRMTTPTATIGIRGTDYAATLCQGDCRNADGTPARDGLYGRVIGQSQGTNQIEVSNDADRKLFGINTNFFTADRNSPVESLLVLPDFVLSKLEGRGRGGSGGSAGGSGSERATSGGASEESRPSTTPDPLPRLQFVVTQNLGPQGSPSVLPPANGFVVVYPLPPNAPLGDVVFDDDTPGTFNNLNQLIAYGSGAFPSGSLGGGSITDTGSLTAANGQVFSWGRWTGNTSVVLSNGTTFTGAPVLFGSASGITTDNSVVGSLGGVATYSYWGGPKPVDAGGNVGSITSSATTINFTTRSQQLSLAMNFPSIVVSGVNTGPAVFNVSGQGVPSPALFTGEFLGFLSGTCTGSGCFVTSPAGYFSTGLTGPNNYGVAVVGGVVEGTKSGDVGFLNAYQLSSFTPGTATALSPNVTGQVAYANTTPFVPGSTTSVSNPNFSGSNLISYGNSAFGGSVNSGSVVDTGSTTLIDGSAMNWGRWTGAGVQVTDPVAGTLNPATGVPYVLGASNTVLPTSGTFLYSYAGGPNPVNVNGTVGSFGGGALSVTFGSTSGSFSVASPLTLALGGVDYSLGSCTSGCTFSGVSIGNGSPTMLSGTCVGGACSTRGGASANVGAIFVGPQAGGIAMAGSISSPAPTVTFGAAFKR